VKQFIAMLIVIFWPVLLAAQDDTASLRNRITELEKDNQRLRNLVTVLSCLNKAQNGISTEAKIADGRKAKIIVGKDDWGAALPQDVAALCVSTAETVFQVITPEAGQEPTILVFHHDRAPMVVSHRGPNGEFLVLLNARDRHWAQMAYQFSHELGHVLCGNLSLDSPQHWFEEAFCESLSLWTVEKMGVSWQTTPPYENWKGYAVHLTDYIAKVRNRVTEPSALEEWYQHHRHLLSQEAYDRDKNLVLAKRLAVAAQAEANFYQSFYYLRKGSDPPNDSMECLLATWIENCPEHLRSGPMKVCEILNVTPQK